MKKANIFYYHFQKFESITGYEHNQEIPYDDVFKIAEEICNKGLNVMIRNIKFDESLGGGEGRILFVDDGRFSQR